MAGCCTEEGGVKSTSSWQKMSLPHLRAVPCPVWPVVPIRSCSPGNQIPQGKDCWKEKEKEKICISQHLHSSNSSSSWHAFIPSSFRWEGPPLLILMGTWIESYMKCGGGGRNNTYWRNINNYKGRVTFFSWSITDFQMGFNLQGLLVRQLLDNIIQIWHPLP